MRVRIQPRPFGRVRSSHQAHSSAKCANQLLRRTRLPTISTVVFTGHTIRKTGTPRWRYWQEWRQVRTFGERPIWRKWAYEQARKESNLDDAAQAKLSKCEPWPAGKDGEGNQQQWGYCTWFTPDDMQEITVELHKPGYLSKSARQFENVPWLAIDVEINHCYVKPPL
jgi:hypothetical protein